MYDIQPAAISADQATSDFVFVPSFCADVLLGSDAPFLAPLLVEMDRCWGIDIKALSQYSPEIAACLLNYWDECGAFWNTPDAPAPSPDAVITIRRNLVDVSQITAPRPARHYIDLDAEFDALGNSKYLDWIPKAIFGAQPDLERYEEAKRAHRTDLVVTPTTKRRTTRTQACLTVQVVNELWPDELGGRPMVGELVREFRVHATYAARRRYKRTRFSRLEVEAIEMWPKPSDEAIETVRRLKNSLLRTGLRNHGRN